MAKESKSVLTKDGIDGPRYVNTKQSVKDISSILNGLKDAQSKK